MTSWRVRGALNHPDTPIARRAVLNRTEANWQNKKAARSWSFPPPCIVQDTYPIALD
jgi:hypothetical protein